MAARILAISYDKALLLTRQWVLQHEGYEVNAALGFVEAQTMCAADGFDLIIICHSLPAKDKAALVRLARGGCVRKILSLRRPNQDPLPDVDRSILSPDNPAELVAAVKNMLDG